MSKKKDNFKDALKLNTKSSVPAKTTKDISKIENATKEIHEEDTNKNLDEVKKEEIEENLNVEVENDEQVKKTSLHIPMDLYKKLKIKAFERDMTLRNLIISTLNEKFK